MLAIARAVQMLNSQFYTHPQAVRTPHAELEAGKLAEGVSRP